MKNILANSPLISVIIPVYNAENFLHYCLDSVLNQTYNNMEIILIDDGSKDHSGIICDEYGKKDSRFIVIHKENSGRSAARNTGLDIAKGDYVFFMDNDDCMSPQTLEILYDATNTDDTAFSMCLGKRAYSYGVNTDVKSINYTIFSQDDLIKRMCQHDAFSIQLLVVWNKLIPMRLIEKERFVDTACEDSDFNIRLYLKSNKAILVNKYLYFWFQRENSVSTHVNYHVEGLASYKLMLSRVSKSDKKYRAYLLWDIYKRLLTAIYHCSKNADFKSDAKDLVSSIKNETWKEFVHNDFICLKKRLCVFVFINIPILYSLFIWTSNNFSIGKITSKINN